MTELQTADRGDIRDLNIVAVMTLLRLRGATTRAGIARETGLSAPTISAVVAALTRAGLLNLSGAGPATGGRRGELIALRPEARMVLAIDLSSEPRRSALVGLTRQLAPGSVSNLPKEALKTPARLAHWIAERVRSMPEIVGVGVAAPGITNSVRGVIEWAPTLGWRDAPIKSEIEAAVPGLTVTVENDLNLAALAEHALGDVGLNDLAMLGLRGGLGAGIIIGGKLHRGVNFAAGELGYLPYPVGRPGTLDFGALEATLFSILPGASPGDAERRPSFVPVGPITDSTASARVVDALAWGSSAVAVVLDVSAIVLGDELLALVPGLDQLLGERLATALPHAPRVVASRLGAFGILQGAATAVHQEIEFDVRRLLS